MAKQQDQQLIRRTLAGQDEAFGELAEKYQDRLFNGMVQILRSEADADDVVQDALVLAFTKLDSFQGNSAFFTWLYRIAYNVAITRLRRRKHHVSIEAQREIRLEYPGSAPQPDEPLQQREEAEQIYAALDKLSEEHRTILILREMDELDYDAISEVLELPIGTVRSRLHRARNHLKEHLEAILNRQ